MRAGVAPRTSHPDSGRPGAPGPYRRWRDRGAPCRPASTAPRCAGSGQTRPGRSPSGATAGDCPGAGWTAGGPVRGYRRGSHPAHPPSPARPTSAASG
ncbi:hypothetical protein G6F65_022626 [Rhizopus arrhizus]|nr:hypothetical protein G6F65_022626 [Rhizopus arrhizus]